jgi:glucose-6-phosphate 1-dehydrogenase
VAGVAPGSKTETYVALRTSAASWRWADVPIAIRAAKCMPVTATEVSFRFRKPPHDAFGLGDATADNHLRFRIHPSNQSALCLVGKKPGKGWHAQDQHLIYTEPPGEDMRPYDRLIGAALSGERWLFARQDTVEVAWDVVQPVLGPDVVPVHTYAKGTWGPAEADQLLPRGEAWHNPAG